MTDHINKSATTCISHRSILTCNAGSAFVQNVSTSLHQSDVTTVQSDTSLSLSSFTFDARTEINATVYELPTVTAATDQIYIWYIVSLPTARMNSDGRRKATA
jgi:hypothetical protein